MMRYEEATRVLLDSRGTPQYWDLIRDLYREVTPEIVKYNGWTDPYFVDWLRLFTPIEYLGWQEVRGNAMHMYPQYPAGRYFLDFADPLNKIAVECDGKQWHDEAMDRRRDGELFELGWCVYRATGSECTRVVQPPAEYEEQHAEEPDYDHLRRWYMDTVDGLCESIRAVHYGKREAIDWHYRSLVAHTYQEDAPSRPDIPGFKRGVSGGAALDDTTY